MIGCTSRHIWTDDLVEVGVGVGVAEPVVGVGVGSDVALGLTEAELVGLAAAELDALEGDVVGVAAALALLLAEALLLALMSGVALLVPLDLLLALAVALGVLAGRNAASRITVVCPAGTVRAALAAAGGEPHTLGAAAAVTAASAGVAAPSSPPAMPDDTMAAPATAPSAVVADRADFMAVLSEPWSSSSRPRVSSAARFARANTIPSCRCSTPTFDETDGKQVPPSGHR